MDIVIIYSAWLAFIVMLMIADYWSDVVRDAILYRVDEIFDTAILIWRDEYYDDTK